MTDNGLMFAALVVMCLSLTTCYGIENFTAVEKIKIDCTKPQK